MTKGIMTLAKTTSARTKTTTSEREKIRDTSKCSEREKTRATSKREKMRLNATEKSSARKRLMQRRSAM